MKDFREQFVRNYLKGIQSTLDSLEDRLIARVDVIVAELLKARENGSTVFIMGNGGSAATASHFAADLCKATICRDLPRFKAIALTDSIPSMLAWANDSGYECIFEEQLKNLMRAGDVLIAISGSGNSPNIIRAVEYANAHGATTIGLSGLAESNRLTRTARISLHVPNDCMPMVEDIHDLLHHLITSLIAEEIQREHA